MIVLCCENVSVWCIDYVILCHVSIELQIRLFPTRTILTLSQLQSVDLL